MSGSFTRLWPNGLYSVCGNAYNDPEPKRWMQPRPVQATYTEGSVVSAIDVRVACRPLYAVGLQLACFYVCLLRLLNVM